MSFSIKLPTTLTALDLYYSKYSNTLESAYADESVLHAIEFRLKTLQESLESVAKAMFHSMGIDAGSVAKSEEILRAKLETVAQLTQNLNGTNYNLAFGQYLNKSEAWSEGEQVIQKRFEFLKKWLRDNYGQGLTQDQKFNTAMAQKFYQFINNTVEEVELAQAKNNTFYRSGGGGGKALKMAEELTEFGETTLKKLRAFLSSTNKSFTQSDVGRAYELEYSNKSDGDTSSFEITVRNVLNFVKLTEKGAQATLTATQVSAVWAAFEQMIIDKCHLTSAANTATLHECINQIKQKEPYSIFVGNGSFKGILGEIQVLFYMRTLFPNMRTDWVGGSTASGLKPHRDLIAYLNNYTTVGIQVKNVDIESAAREETAKYGIDFKSFNAGFEMGTNGLQLSFTDDAERALRDLGLLNGRDADDIFEAVAALSAFRKFNVPYIVTDKRAIGTNKRILREVPIEQLDTNRATANTKRYVEIYKGLWSDKVDNLISRVLIGAIAGLMYMETGLDAVRPQDANTLYVIGGNKVITAYSIITKILANLKEQLRSLSLHTNFTASKRRDARMNRTVVDVINTAGSGQLAGGYEFTTAFRFQDYV